MQALRSGIGHARGFHPRCRNRVEALSLSGRLALLTALALVATAAVLLLFRHPGTGGGDQTARQQTEFVADSILRNHLRPQDLRSPVRGARRGQLDRLFRSEILIDGNVRANIYDARGRITYSTDHALIGRVFLGVESRARPGRAAVIGDANPGAVRGTSAPAKLLATYVQLRLGSGAPGGIFELFEHYTPVAASPLFVPLTAVLGLALLALYISILPVPRSVAKRIRAQMEQMEQMERFTIRSRAFRTGRCSWIGSSKPSARHDAKAPPWRSC